MKYQIIIKNLENGTIETDVKTNAIIATIGEDGGDHNVFITHCNAIEITALLLSARKNLETQIKTADPRVKLLMDAYDDIKGKR